MSNSWRSCETIGGASRQAHESVFRPHSSKDRKVRFRQYGSQPPDSRVVHTGCFEYTYGQEVVAACIGDVKRLCKYCGSARITGSAQGIAVADQPLPGAPAGQPNQAFKSERSFVPSAEGFIRVSKTYLRFRRGGVYGNRTTSVIERLRPASPSFRVLSLKTLRAFPTEATVRGVRVGLPSTASLVSVRTVWVLARREPRYSPVRSRPGSRFGDHCEKGRWR